MHYNVTKKMFVKFLNEVCEMGIIRGYTLEQNIKRIKFFTKYLTERCGYLDEDTHTIKAIDSIKHIKGDNKNIPDMHIIPSEGEPLFTLSEYGESVKNFLLSTESKKCADFIDLINENATFNKDMEGGISPANTALFAIMSTIYMIEPVPRILFNDIIQNKDNTDIDMMQVSLATNILCGRILSIFGIASENWKDAKDETVVMQPYLSLYVEKDIDKVDMDSCVFYRTMFKDDIPLYHIIVTDIGFTEMGSLL